MKYNGRTQLHQVLMLVCMLFSTVLFMPKANALIITMPNSNWITQYGIGLCINKYPASYNNAGSYKTWAELTQLQQAGTLFQLRENEPICLLGHGAPGEIGRISAADIADTLFSVVVPNPEGNSNLYLMACNSATPQPGVTSVLNILQTAAIREDSDWRGGLIAGSLGICVADSTGAFPLYRKVLRNPLPPAGNCSSAALTAEQNRLQTAVQADINLCQTQVGDVAIGNCLYANANIRNNFYTPFLGYITANNCNQNPGVYQTLF